MKYLDQDLFEINLSLFVPKYEVEWEVEYFVLIMSDMSLSCTFVKGKLFIFLRLSEIFIQLIHARVYTIIILLDKYIDCFTIV